MKIRFLSAIFAASVCFAQGALANCYGYSWTYHWNYLYPQSGYKTHGLGCNCSESGTGYEISFNSTGAKAFVSGGTRSSGGQETKVKCDFPKFSECKKIATKNTKGQSAITNNWGSCGGRWLNPNYPQIYPTDLLHVRTWETNEGWAWECVSGYKYDAVANSCVAVVAGVVESNETAELDSCPAGQGFYLGSKSQCIACAPGRVNLLTGECDKCHTYDVATQEFSAILDGTVIGGQCKKDSDIFAIYPETMRQCAFCDGLLFKPCVKARSGKDYEGKAADEEATKECYELGL